VGASIIAGVDASPVLEATKHVFDFVGLSVVGLIVIDLYSAVGSRWESGCYAARRQGDAEPGSGLSLIFLCRTEFRALMIAG